LTSATMIVAFWLQFGSEIFRRTAAARVLLWLGAGSIAAAAIATMALRTRRRNASGAQ
jgi:hypothetical protein